MEKESTHLSQNELFPVFLKLENKRILVVGGGPIACEKLQALFSNSPRTRIRLVAEILSDDTRILAQQFMHCEIHERRFVPADLTGVHLVLGAVNDPVAAEEICRAARKIGVPVNIADKPDLCDFYLGSIVRKGHLKIAISTNGKSPTMAKRLKEVLADLLPDELDELLDNMQRIRNSLKGDFAEKVRTLNEVTRSLTPSEKTTRFP